MFRGYGQSRWIGFVAALLAAVYLVAGLGMVPSPRMIGAWMGALNTERYPCEDSGCGCSSAKQCWTACACFTERQRLAWAIEQGVMPPEGLEFSDALWVAAANDVRPGLAHCALCVPEIRARLAQGIATPRVGAMARASCCGGGATEASQVVGACEDGNGGGHSCGSGACSGGCCGSARSSRWSGFSISALSCKGVEQLMLVSVPPAPGARVVLLPPPAPAPMAAALGGEPVMDSRALDVPTPPPRG